eukprot:c25781_g1_i1 orf=400-1485(+)
MGSFSLWVAVRASQIFAELLDGEGLFKFLASMCLRRRCPPKFLDKAEEGRGFCLLDLPESALDEILCRLPAASLCQMMGVCRELRVRCRSDHLWKCLFDAKWGRIAGAVAYKEWQWRVARNSHYGDVDCPNSGNRIRSLSCIWPFSWLKGQGNEKKEKGGSSLDSIVVWYCALESGNFWFPGQVYNREHGNVGFMLSCYDAELSYDHRTNTFRARYPPHNSRTTVIEEGVEWERVRAPPVDTPAHDLHLTDCLDELQPGDHVEVQWRRNEEFPYGWWYGVVGHADMCDRDSHHCHCHLDDTVWLEFNQYTLGSRWRRAAVNRKTHHVEGNESDGFYGGIWKLRTKDEISAWRQLWPREALE